MWLAFTMIGNPNHNTAISDNGLVYTDMVKRPGVMTTSNKNLHLDLHITMKDTANHMGTQI